MYQILLLNQRNYIRSGFNYHRILAECKNCKLYQGETTEGYLVTYKDNDFINATDLKFLETDEKGIVICPLCKNKIDVSLTDLEEEQCCTEFISKQKKLFKIKKTYIK